MAQNHSPLIIQLSPNLTAAQRFRLGVGGEGGVIGAGAGHRVSGRDGQNQFQRQYQDC